MLPAKSDNNTIIAAFTYTRNNGSLDYHFAIQLSNGMWADKPGKCHSRYGELTFDGVVWTDNKAIKGLAENTTFFVISED